MVISISYLCFFVINNFFKKLINKWKIKEADIDANGSIEFDEFFNLLTSFLNEIDGAGE